jgi:hypothetical protein
MIFFHDKHWGRSEPLFSVEEEDEDEEVEDEEDDSTLESSSHQVPSPTHSEATIKSGPASTVAKKNEYEFLLFNYLLRFVHREGKIGDFARAGLLFLMDVAMSPRDATKPAHVDDDSGVEAEAPPSDPITDAALALAEYIIDGDFSEVLGAGLAAVYSVLPMKLQIKSAISENATTGATMVIGSKGVETEDEREIREFNQEKNQALGLESSTSPDFKGRLEHFLKLLEFLQDILRRNVHGGDETFDPSALVGNAIVNSILDAVRRTFLENVLYPSILECSDLDGSAVAVMSYIEAMVSTLRHDQLADLLVEFLMSEDSDAIAQPRNRQAMVTLGSTAPPRSQSSAFEKSAKARRRKSTAMVLLEMEAPDSTKQSEYFTTMSRFTLKDLLLANLRSESQATAAAALQLLQSMLVQHCQLTIDKLIIVHLDQHATNFPEPIAVLPITNFGIDDEEDTFTYPGSEEEPSQMVEKPFESVFALPDTTISTHEREMNLYLTLVSRVDPAHSDDAFSTGYDNYVRDALLSIQDQTCFYADIDPKDRGKRKHRLNPNDPILTLVLGSLRTFFANTPEYNMTLTGVLATLALCPDRSLSGWLTFALKDKKAGLASHQDEGSDDVDDDDRSVDFSFDEKLATETIVLPAASVDEQSRPVVHTVLQGLVTQLERYRHQIEDFDKYLLERRQGLLFSENLTDALTLSLEPESNPISLPVIIQPEPSARPKPKPTISSSLVSFLTPKKSKPATPAAMPAEAVALQRDDHTHVHASPFGSHYKQTTGVTVEPYAAPIPTSSSWVPAKSSTWHDGNDDPFSSSSAWGEGKGSLKFDDASAGGDSSREIKATPKRVTLSHLLDNVVILEESIKELVAIIQARRSLGIDSLRYL